MKILRKIDYVARILVTINPQRALSNLKNVYLLHGWKGVKEIIGNKLNGKPVAPLGEVYKNNCDRSDFCNRVLKTQQEELVAKVAIGKIDGFRLKPLISVVMPMYDAPIQWLDIAIRSLENQYYANWELCVVDDASKARRCIDVVEKYANKDQRIRLIKSEQNGGISVASNIAINMAKGDFIALLDQDDELPPDAFFWFVKEFNENPSADFMYSDECKVSAVDENVFFDFLIKPDWSPMLMVNNMFAGHLVMYRRELLSRIGGFDSKFDFAQDYELAMRIGQAAKCIRHIPRILYFWRALPTSTAAGGKVFSNKTNMYVAHNYFNKRGFENVVYKKMHYNYADIFNLKWKVSFIVPSDSFDNVKNLIDGLTIGTSYTNYEFVFVVNSSMKEKIDSEFIYLSNIKICCFDETINIAKKLNFGAERASGDVVIFMHDDVVPRNSDWVDRLVEFLVLPEIGAVSPAVVTLADKIEYAGATTAVNTSQGLSGCMLKGEAFFDNFFHYLHSPWVVREYSILSPVCMAIKKDVFDSVGGFNFLDTPNYRYHEDFGFELQKKGYQCLYNPHATLYHERKDLLSKVVGLNGEKIFCLKKWASRYTYDQYFTPTMKKELFGTDELELEVFSNNDAVYSEKNKKNIAVFSHELTRTGAPVVLLDAVKVMLADGNFVVLVSPFDGPLRQEFVDAGAIVIIDKRTLWGRCQGVDFSFFKEAWYMDELIQEFDVVFMCTMLLHNLVNRYADKVKTIIWWLHEGQYTLEHMKVFLTKEISNNVEVFCGGKYVQNKLAGFDIRYLSNVLLYGVADRAITVDKKRTDDKVRFLLAGTIDRRKGQDILVQAIRSLPDDYQNKAEFIFVGMLHEVDIYQMVECLSNENDNVKLMQSISREELFSLYQSIDCVVSPSRDDPMPVVMTEAMMFSKVCICSTHTGTSYYLKDGHNGFVFENENVEELAKKIKYIIDNNEALNDLKLNSRKVYEDIFAMDIFAKQLKGIINKH